MEVVHGTNKTTRFASEDVISCMPEGVITDILNRLPIQDAMRTSILARNWRLKWTLLTQLVFDDKFFEYLRRTQGGNHDNVKMIISRILLHLRGDITKFVLYIPKSSILDDEDINHWVLYSSTKGVKELALRNKRVTPLNLPTHLFSCLQLRHLKLRKCIFRPSPTFQGFPNLLSLGMHLVTFVGYKFGELISRCPLLENLMIGSDETNRGFKQIDIAKLENLKRLSLPFYLLDDVDTERITSPRIFSLMCSLPQLQDLSLGFGQCKFLADNGDGNSVPTVLPCLRTLGLHRVDLSSDIMASCVFKMICSTPNLQTLEINATYNNVVEKPAICSSEVDCSSIGKLQLRNVVLASIKGSESEVCFIKFLLDHSPWLKKIVIQSLVVSCEYEKLMFATKLLKLDRASPTAKIDLR